MSDCIIAVDAVMSGPPVAAVDVIIGAISASAPPAVQCIAGSVTPIPPSTIAFVGIGWSIDETKAQMLVLVDGIITDFGLSIGDQAIGPGSIIAKLRKNVADTTAVVTLSGVEQFDYVTDLIIPVVKGDLIDVRVAMPAGAANMIVTASWRLEPT